MTIIDGGDDNTVAANDGTRKTLVIVTTNHGVAQWIGYDLSQFGVVKGKKGGVVDRWQTNTAGGEMYTHHADTHLSGKEFRVFFPANTVQTFEVDNTGF